MHPDNVKKVAKALSTVGVSSAPIIDVLVQAKENGSY
jgi:hypothetical protein